MRCDKCGWYRPKHAVCEFDDTLTEPYESCSNWKPVTNADKIRAMTDEELAVFMNDVAQRGGIPIGGSVMKWFIWLKQEADND